MSSKYNHLKSFPHLDYMNFPPSDPQMKIDEPEGNNRQGENLNNGYSSNEKSNPINLLNNNDNLFQIDSNSTKSQTKKIFNKNNSLLNKKRKNTTAEKDQKNNLFIIVNTNNTKNINIISEKGKFEKVHDIFYLDNIIKKIDNKIWKFMIKHLNIELKQINDDFEYNMLLSLGYKENINKEYYKDLMEKPFKEKLEENVSRKYDKNKKNFNKMIIAHIYDQYQKGNKKYSNIVKLLDLKFGVFLKFLSFYLEYKDKEINHQKIVEEIDQNYLFLVDIIKNFLIFLDEQVLKKLKNKEKVEQYKKIFYIVLSDYHILSKEEYKNLLNTNTLDTKYNIIKVLECDNYFVTNIDNNNQYVARICKYIPKDPNNLKVQSIFENELQMTIAASGLKNPNIIHLFENGIGTLTFNGVVTNNVKYMILEYCPKGNLFNYINKYKRGFTEKHGKYIFKKILLGVQALHGAGYCHRDLKMQKILLDQNFNPKISGFHFATQFQQNNQPILLKDFLVTENYASPQILSFIPYNGERADIFSLGVIVFILVTGTIGFHEVKKTDQYYEYIKFNYNGKYWSKFERNQNIMNLSNEFKDLYFKMVAYNENERPNISQVLSHHWFDEIKNLDNQQLSQLELDLRNEFLAIESKKD